MIFDHQHATSRCAGHEGVAHVAGSELADIDEVKAVHVLVGQDCLGHSLFIEVAGQRQLYEYAVNAVVGVQLVDQRQDIVLGSVLVERMLHRVKATAFRALFLVADIDLAGRVLTDDDNGEPGLELVLLEEIGRFGRNLFGHLGGFYFAIDACCVAHSRKFLII